MKWSDLSLDPVWPEMALQWTDWAGFLRWISEFALSRIGQCDGGLIHLAAISPDWHA